MAIEVSLVRQDGENQPKKCFDHQDSQTYRLVDPVADGLATFLKN